MPPLIYLIRWRHMALIAITINDTPEGELNVTAAAEPLMPEDSADATPAQQAAALMLSALATALAADASEKLVVVGADSEAQEG